MEKLVSCKATIAISAGCSECVMVEYSITVSLLVTIFGPC